MNYAKVKISVEVEVPEGATHYAGNITDEPTWYKCTQVGVVGDHWWFCEDGGTEWRLAGHFTPHFVKPLTEVLVK